VSWSAHNRWRVCVFNCSVRNVVHMRNGSPGEIDRSVTANRHSNSSHGASGFFGDDERGPTTGWPYRISRPRGRFANFVREHEISGRGSSGSAWLAVIFAAIAFVLFGLMLFGCAQRYVPAPSAAAVHASITSTQTHIDQASQQNVEARSVAQRIHDKDLLIDRWNETHRK
jgi:hypothetical protein